MGKRGVISNSSVFFGTRKEAMPTRCSGLEDLREVFERAVWWVGRMRVREKVAFKLGSSKQGNRVRA